MNDLDPQVARGGRSSPVLLLSALLCAILVVVVFRMRGEHADATEAAAPSKAQRDAASAEPSSSSTRTPIGVPQDPAAPTPTGNVEPASEASQAEPTPAPDPEKELAAQLRSLEDYKAMSIEELEAERARLSKLFSAVITPLHTKLYEQGYGINLGPLSKEGGYGGNDIPPQYKGQNVAWHYTGGVDAMYITVLEPVEHAELYKVDKTMKLLADLANEKRFPR